MPTTVPLRVVVVRYGTEVVGGAESLARSIAERLAARGTPVEVVTSRAVDEATWADAYPAGDTVVNGVSVRRLGVIAPRRPDRFRSASRLFWRLPPRLRPEHAWVRAAGPRLGGLAAELARPVRATLFVSYLYAPFVEGVHRTAGVRLLLPTAHDEPALALRCVGRAVAACHGLWYATPEERTLVETTHPAAAHLAAEVGNAGIQPPMSTDPEGFRAAAGVVGPYLLYGGRATAGKGVGELTAAVEQLRIRGHGVSVVLTGEAGCSVAARPGVVPVGRLDAQRRWDAIAGAAAVVVPSRHESLSLLALEAWAVGRPVLVNAASPVLRGQVERSGGGLAWSGVDGLAAAAEHLLENPDLAARLGAAGHEHVRRTYRWDAVLDRFDALLAAATASGTRR